MQGFVDRHGSYVSISADLASTEGRCRACRGRRSSWRAITRPWAEKGPVHRQRPRDTSLDPGVGDRHYESAAFKALKPITQGVYRKTIALRRETDKESQPFGDKSAVTIKAHHVEPLMEARADKPESAKVCARFRGR